MEYLRTCLTWLIPPCMLNVWRATLHNVQTWFCSHCTGLICENGLGVVFPVWKTGTKMALILTQHHIQLRLFRTWILYKNQNKTKIYIITLILNCSDDVFLRATASKLFQIQLSHNWIMTMFYSRVCTSKEFPLRDYQVKGQKMNNVLWLYCHDL